MSLGKTIRISNQTYKELSNQGTLNDSFDSVIRKLIQNQIQIKKSSGQNV